MNPEGMFNLSDLLFTNLSWFREEGNEVEWITEIRKGLPQNGRGPPHGAEGSIRGWSRSVRPSATAAGHPSCFFAEFWTLLRIKETDLHVGDWVRFHQMNLHLFGWQYS